MTSDDFRAWLEEFMEYDEAHGLAVPFHYQVPELVEEVLTDAQRGQIVQAYTREVVAYFGTWEAFQKRRHERK